MKTRHPKAELSNDAVPIYGAADRPDVSLPRTSLAAVCQLARDARHGRGLPTFRQPQPRTGALQPARLPSLARRRIVAEDPLNRRNSAVKHAMVVLGVLAMLAFGAGPVLAAERDARIL